MNKINYIVNLFTENISYVLEGFIDGRLVLFCVVCTIIIAANTSFDVFGKYESVQGRLEHARKVIVWNLIRNFVFLPFILIYVLLSLAVISCLADISYMKTAFDGWWVIVCLVLIGNVIFKSANHLYKKIFPCKAE